MDATKNIVVNSSGKTVLQPTNQTQTAEIPIIADINIAVGGRYRRTDVVIKHGSKEIYFSPYGTTDMIDLMFSSGLTNSLLIRKYSKVLVDFTNTRLPRLIRGATSNVQGDEIAGGLSNTFRHFAWQSVITMAYGKGIAKQIGDYHEKDGIFNGGQGNNFIKDNIIDLVNNEYARDYGAKFNFDEVTKSVENFSGYLNGLVQHLTSTVDGYKNDSRFDNLRSGKTKLFDSKSNAVRDVYDSAIRIFNPIKDDGQL